jgi:hypothetical protein
VIVAVPAAGAVVAGAEGAVLDVVVPDPSDPLVFPDDPEAAPDPDPAVADFPPDPDTARAVPPLIGAMAALSAAAGLDDVEV